MTNTYDNGDVVHIEATFTIAGVATNPAAVTCQLRAPDGTLTTPAVSTSGTGVYYADITPTLPGTYAYRFAGTGAAQAAGEKTFHVRASSF